MLAKIAGSNQFKVGTGDKSWSELDYQPNVSGNNGLIYKDNELIVDFSQMPTDKFEAIVKSLKVKIWLTENTNFYVDGTNGSDVLSEGRGLSEDKSFKTIQACIDYVSTYYSLGIFNITIIISDGIYQEFLTCGYYESTSGAIILLGKNDKKAVIQPPANNFNLKAVYVTGGKIWHIQNLQINRIIDFSSNIITNHYYPGCLQVILNSSAYITNCGFLFKATNIGNIRTYDCRIIETQYFGCIIIMAGPIKTEIDIEENDVNLVMIIYSQNGTTAFNPSTENNNMWTVKASKFFSFIEIREGGVAYVNGGLYIRQFNLESGTGYRYRAMNFGTIITNGGGANYFPGTLNGIVDSISTYY